MVGIARVTQAIGLGVLSFLMLASSPAQAEELTARAWFEAGVKSYEEGRYTVALAAFQEAYRLTPRPGLLFSIAQAFRRSYEEEGNLTRRQDAIDYYERYLAESPQGDRAAEARSWLEQLRRNSEASASLAAAEAVEADGDFASHDDAEATEQAPTTVSVTLRRLPSSLEITGSPGAIVYLDGQRVATLPMRPLRLEHGRHTLEVLEAGHHGVRRVIELEPGEARRLQLAGPPTVRHVASWLFVGAGSAAIATGGVFGYLALQHESDARALQDTPGARLDFDAALDARNRLRAAAALSAGLGVAAVLGGTVSLATERPTPARPAPATAGARTVIGFVFPAGVAVSGTF